MRPASVTSRCRRSGRRARRRDGICLGRVAGSRQSHGRAELVGDRTFGKGSVQVAYALRDGSAINLTVQHWYLPGGRSINGTGLTPDVTVALSGPGAMFDVVQPARGYAADTQLQRALEQVSGR